MILLWKLPMNQADSEYTAKYYLQVTQNKDMKQINMM